MKTNVQQLRDRCRFRPGRDDATSAYGHTYSTPRAASEINPDDAHVALKRHLRGFWGDCSPDTLKGTDFAVARGVLRLTVHYDRNNVKFGIITNAPMLDTTVFMPGES